MVEVGESIDSEDCLSTKNVYFDSQQGMIVMQSLIMPSLFLVLMILQSRSCCLRHLHHDDDDELLTHIHILPRQFLAGANSQ